MNRLLLITALLLMGDVFTSIHAQTLSIEEAVTGRNGELYPDRPQGLKWVKDKDYFSIIEGDSILYVKDRRGKIKETITLNILNESFESSNLNSFPNPNWISSNSFWFQHKNAFYTYEMGDARVKLAAKCAGEANNTDYHPGSQKVAYTNDNDLLIGTAESVVNITNHEDPNIVSGQSIHRNEFGISKGTFWSPDGKKLAFYQKDESDVTAYPLVNYSNTPATLNDVKYPMAGQGSEKAIVGIYDTETQDLTYIEPRKELGKYHYYTNLAWSPDGSLIYIAEINRDQNEVHLNTYDAESGFYLKTLFQESHEKYVEPEHPPIFLNDDGSQFLWFSERDGFNHLYLYSSDGQLIRQLTSGEFPVTEYIGCDAKGKYIWVEANGPSPLDKHIYRVSLSGEIRKLSIAEGVHNASLSDGGSYLMDFYSNSTTPYRVVMMTGSGKIAQEVHKSEDPLQGVAIGKTEIVQVKANDETTLYGRLIYPVNFDPNKKYPVLTYVYNGPHVQLVSNSWMNRASLWMHSMAGEGYLVWTLDGRGSLNRGRDFEQAVFRNLGDLEIEDQIAGIEYLKTKDFVDADRMAVHGWSYGGFMTTSLMLREPEIFKVGVAGGPVIDWSYYEVMYTERYMDTPETNPEGFKKANLKNYVDQLQGDLLMIHGTSDDVVVMQHNMSFLQACIDKGVQIDFFAYPGHGHNVRGKDRVHLMEKVLTYIKERL